MEYSVKLLTASTVKTACIVIGISEGRKLSLSAADINTQSNGYLDTLLKTGDFQGKPGETLMLYNVPGIAAQRVLLVGCGNPKKMALPAYLALHTAAAKRLAESNISEAVSCLTEIDVENYTLPALIQQAVLASEDVLYRFNQLKSRNSNSEVKLQKLIFAQSDKNQLAAGKKAVSQGMAIAEGVRRCKTLGNLPGNICTPSYLAKQAKSLQREFNTIATTIIEEAEMKKLGMGAFLSVSRGSHEAGKLIIMEYNQGKKSQAPLVLVGKGITFDTGGISIKPALGMDEMKFDMCGAASVFGTLVACAKMDLPINLVGIVAAAENMPGSSASKPGDIVTSLSGQTIEILNTDAEGRLVLCDALTYVERYKPSAVIDIATLTGAVIVALGRHPSGLLGNDPGLLESLKQAGERSGDRVWELPLWDEYAELLKSNFADLANVGNRDGGSITAASFLSHFTKKYRWAHLDIAGTAWHTGNKKGATGRPVPLLVEHILSTLI